MLEATSGANGRRLKWALHCCEEGLVQRNLHSPPRSSGTDYRAKEPSMESPGRALAQALVASAFGEGNLNVQVIRLVGNRQYGHNLFC